MEIKLFLVKEQSTIIRIGRAPTSVGRKHRGGICGSRLEVHRGAVILARETILAVSGNSISRKKDTCCGLSIILTKLVLVQQPEVKWARG